MKRAINIVFPHQLFEDSPLLHNGLPIYLIEEFLFFKQYKFHKQKIAFHRASMKNYQIYLENRGLEVFYIESTERRSDIREFVIQAFNDGVSQVNLIDPTDNWLEKRIRATCPELEVIFSNNPSFLNTRDELSSFFRSDKKFFFQTTFYKQQRKKRSILLEHEGTPVGGKWTYDTENRKKYPKGKIPPSIYFPLSEQWKPACQYVEKYFKDCPGKLSPTPLYPLDHQAAKAWLEQFLDFRFHQFGDYEDAIVAEASILHHSVLSPLINTGLLIPETILEKALDYAISSDVPINSTEGFIRQIIGWREFIRGMYECKGSSSRTMNYWGFHRKIPPSFYYGQTGIPPIDNTIEKVLNSAYCHHIERLMILGNFMLLCEFSPNEVYRWFMELFIDAYDWVMVPNVYGMSQFADAGLFATKPYISGSNYVKKMSDYPKGDWQEIWDGLFWRFIHQHEAFFLKNPRTSMMVYSFRKMNEEKKKSHLSKAEAYLKKLDESLISS